MNATSHWPDPVDEILDGDHVVMLAYVTPAKGVVLLPVSNFAVRDHQAGTVTAVNTARRHASITPGQQSGPRGSHTRCWAGWALTDSR